MPPDPEVSLSKTFGTITNERQLDSVEEEGTVEGIISESKSLILSDPVYMDGELQSTGSNYRETEDFDSSDESLPFLGNDIQTDQEELLEEEDVGGDLIGRARRFLFSPNKGG